MTLSIDENDEAHIFNLFCELSKTELNKRLELFRRRLRSTLEKSLTTNDLNHLLLAKKDNWLDAPIGFNGQVVRASLLINIMRSTSCDIFIETGTDLGETCFLIAAQTELQVRSCNLPHRSQAIANEIAVLFDGRVQLFLLDSREFLTKQFADVQFQKPFVYLDAHWEPDIPLRDELKLILGSAPRDFIVVVDDFKVPHDSGFRFDEYDNGVLEWSYITDIIKQSARTVKAFYPAYPSTSETGQKRGFLLITSESLGSYIEAEWVPEFLKHV